MQKLQSIIALGTGGVSARETRVDFHRRRVGFSSAPAPLYYFNTVAI